MKKITKKSFYDRHAAGDLQLICGMAKKPMAEVMEAISQVRDKIEQYLTPTSNHGNLETSKDGYQTCNIYLSDCEDFIFIETVIDSSKCDTCSWDTIETYTTAYLAC